VKLPDEHSAIELLRIVRDQTCGGLLTDIDGTISEISQHPADATVSIAAREALQNISQQLCLVGAVSGRSAEEARQLVGLDSLVYSGNHGMELWRNGSLEQSPLAVKYVPLVRKLLGSLKSPVGLEGIFVEDKHLTASIHYRNAADPEHAEQFLAEEILEKAQSLGLKVTRGRMVIEIRPPVELNKGTSVIELAEEYQLNGLVYLGDDVTDVDAFVALRERRQQTGGHFYAIGVESDDTPASVVENADALVNGVDGVLELLNQLR
jgi:trehalose 6-phosphate phosphatase